jgi:hypothetical protein
MRHTRKQISPRQEGSSAPVQIQSTAAYVKSPDEESGASLDAAVVNTDAR